MGALLLLRLGISMAVHGSPPLEFQEALIADEACQDGHSPFVKVPWVPVASKTFCLIGQRLFCYAATTCPALSFSAAFLLLGLNSGSISGCKAGRHSMNETAGRTLDRN